MSQMTNAPTLSWTGATTFGLITADLDATIAFYRDILDLEPGPISDASELYPRHCFLAAAEGREVLHVHVIEHPRAQRFALGIPLHALENENAYAAQGGQVDTSMPACYFAMWLADGDAGTALRTRLLENGVECTRPIDRGPVLEVVFRDNNGMMLSARWLKNE